MFRDAEAPAPFPATRCRHFRRRPAQGLIHHSDRGSTYCSHDYRKRLGHYATVCSMSRKGDGYDNAPMESLLKSPKVERVNLRRYATREQARSDTFSYVETFYNPRRLHSSLGYVSPREFEPRFAAKKAARRWPEFPTVGRV